MRGGAQARFFLGCGARRMQAGRQSCHFAGQGLKHLFFRELASARCLAGTNVPEPLGDPEQGSAQAPANNQQREGNNQHGLRGAGEYVLPYRCAGVRRIMEDGDHSNQMGLGAEGERQDKHRHSGNPEKFPADSSPVERLPDGGRSHRQSRDQLGGHPDCHGEGLPVAVIEHFAGEAVVVAKLIHKGLVVPSRSGLQNLLRGSLLALGQDESLALDIVPKSMHLSPGLVHGEPDRHPSHATE